MSSLITQMSLKGIYEYFSTKRRREKLDYILEPLQAITQLALLAYCPVGTKLTIHDNILIIQQPGISQSITRYFNEDSKEDLYYLMNVFKRLFTFYSFMTEDKLLNKLYNLLIKNAIIGIDNLLKTYTNSDKVNVLHTLQMYKVVLGNPDFFHTNKMGAEDINIDNIFNEIVNIYNNEEYYVIYNILLLLEKYPGNYQEYIIGLNAIMDIKNKKIKEWIDKNIAL
jgi:hypothetical protein